MKQALSPQDLHNKLIDYQQRANDYVLSADKLSADVIELSSDEEDKATKYVPLFQLGQGNEQIQTQLTSKAHTQLAERLNVSGRHLSSRYLKGIAETHPDLWVETVNTFLESTSKDRLIRTMSDDSILSGTWTRGILSPNYAIRDNAAIINTIQPILGDPSFINGEFEILSCNLTMDKMVIKVATPQLEGEVREGDPVRGGFIITNDETGGMSTRIEPFIYRLVCTNGMVLPDDTYSKRYRHLGERMVVSDDIYQPLQQDTIDKANAAFFAGLGDILRTILSQDVFGRHLELMKAATNREFVPSLNIPQFFKKIETQYNLNEEQGQQILSNFFNGSNTLNNQWGVVNAVTAAAEHEESYDSATELETLGSKILKLNDNEWKSLLED